MTEVTHKICKTCGELKPLDSFAKAKAGKFGRIAHCKPCKKQAFKTLVATASKERIAANQKTEKKCSVCGELLPVAAFSPDRRALDGLQSSCKTCRHSAATAVKAAEGAAAREQRLLLHREYSKRYRRRQKKLELAGIIAPMGREARFIRNTLHRVLRATKQSKISRSEKMLGYSAAQLRARLELNFLPGMTWKNASEWHIDHTIPLSYFLKKGETRPAVINALCNLRPMWAEENISKKDKVPSFLERSQ